MYIEEIIGPDFTGRLENIKSVGIDIGSRTGKGVLLAGDRIYTAITNTGTSMQNTADELVSRLLATSGLSSVQEIGSIAATGYGRIAVRFDVPFQVLTEISCHAAGAFFLDRNIRTVIDIGGQDSKAIKINPETGGVADFAMNDKCAAGTGRFLEKMAEFLSVSIEDLGEMSLKGGKTVDISSQCVVFAESEVISALAGGCTREDIAAGIHRAAARRVKSLLNRIGAEPSIVFSGGVSNNIGMRAALEDAMEQSFVNVKMNMLYAGALGVAMYAHSRCAPGPGVKKTSAAPSVSGFAEIKREIRKFKSAFINGASSMPRIGYFCNYTPAELLSAAGAASIRLFSAGGPEMVSCGETFTQSTVCDFTKATLGAFKNNDPLYSALDRVFLFSTCGCVKKTGETLAGSFLPADMFILPRQRDRESSREFYYQEILNMGKRLEEITGVRLSRKKLAARNSLYRELRCALLAISELRKRSDPPITGKQFLELMVGYYYLPPERLLPLLRTFYSSLRKVPDGKGNKLRVMIAGSITAEGDRKLLDLAENKLGAAVVVEDHCSGVKALYNSAPETTDPFRDIAESYLDQAPCAFMKPLSDSVDFSVSLAREYGVEGVLYVYQKFCSCYGQSKIEFVRGFREIGIPVMELSMDYSSNDTGQLATRLEAFFEILKEGRKKCREIA